jgi:hypothetical protein
VVTALKANSIRRDEPFDRVTLFFPDEKGEPGAFLGFAPDTGRMTISRSEPSYFQRFPASTPQAVRDAFPEKVSGSQSFILFDELGKKIVCSFLPVMMAGRQQPVRNEPALINVEQVQRSSEHEPRVTVVTSFRDGSCAMGSWMFVVDWQGKKACIMMETPSITAKPPARIDFCEERLLQRCSHCGVFWVLRGEGAPRHACPAALAAARNYRR